MWARIIEFMLGCWLLVSPFIFQHGDRAMLWAADYTCASAAITLALLSYWPPMRYAHLGTVGVALLMIVVGRVAAGVHAEAAYQNYILVGLLLLMFAIVPSHASQPPRGWCRKRDEPAGPA